MSLLGWHGAPRSQPCTHPPTHPPRIRRDAPPVAVLPDGASAPAAVSAPKVVVLVAVLVGAASAMVALVTYWAMRER